MFTKHLKVGVDKITMLDVALANFYTSSVNPIKVIESTYSSLGADMILTCHFNHCQPLNSNKFKVVFN